MFLTLAFLIMVGSMIVSAQEDFSAEYVMRCPNAPADYDANLKKGDLAMADANWRFRAKNKLD